MERSCSGVSTPTHAGASARRHPPPDGRRHPRRLHGDAPTEGASMRASCPRALAGGCEPRSKPARSGRSAISRRGWSACSPTRSRRPELSRRPADRSAPRGSSSHATKSCAACSQTRNWPTSASTPSPSSSRCATPTSYGRECWTGASTHARPSSPSRPTCNSGSAMSSTGSSEPHRHDGEIHVRVSVRIASGPARLAEGEGSIQLVASGQRRDPVFCKGRPRPTPPCQ